MFALGDKVHRTFAEGAARHRPLLMPCEEHSTIKQLWITRNAVLVYNWSPGSVISSLSTEYFLFVGVPCPGSTDVPVSGTTLEWRQIKTHHDQRQILNILAVLRSGAQLQKQTKVGRLEWSSVLKAMSNNHDTMPFSSLLHGIILHFLVHNLTVNRSFKQVGN